MGSLVKDILEKTISEVLSGVESRELKYTEGDRPSCAQRLTASLLEIMKADGHWLQCKDIVPLQNQHFPGWPCGQKAAYHWLSAISRTPDLAVQFQAHRRFGYRWRDGGYTPPEHELIPAGKNKELRNARRRRIGGATPVKRKSRAKSGVERIKVVDKNKVNLPQVGTKFCSATGTEWTLTGWRDRGSGLMELSGMANGPDGPRERTIYKRLDDPFFADYLRESA